MIIRFNQMDITVLPEFKGGKKELSANMFFDGTNRIFKGRLVPGASIGMHTHEDSCEAIFIIEGSGTIIEKEPCGCSETSSAVSSGDCLYCPKGHSHGLVNSSEQGDLVFYAVVPQQ